MPRRAMLAGALAVLAASATGARTPQAGAPGPDAVGRLLARLEASLQTGQVDGLRALTAGTLTPESLEVFERAVSAGAPDTATIRERSRAPKDAGYEVIADVLIGRGRGGRLATWTIETQSSAAGIDAAIVSLAETASLPGLVRLALDATRQFTVRNFRFEAPDFVVTMRSGTAFVAEDDGGVTAIVLHGRGDVSFTPPDEAEQGQLRILGGRPTFETGFEDAFVRINSADYDARVSTGALTQAQTVDPERLERARSVFADRARRSYNLDLQHLSAERWSIAPVVGSALVDFRAGRWGWLSYVRSPNDAEDVVLFDRAQGRNLSSYASAERLQQRSRFYSEDDRRAYDIERYDVDVTFSPDRRFITGRARLHLRVASQAVSALTLRLDESLAVGTVTSPQFKRLLAVRVAGQNSVIVNLPTYVAQGSPVDLDISYSGRLNPEDIDRDTVAPKLADTDVPAGLTIDPEPRFLFSSQVAWYPQSPVTDYATAVMQISVPSDYQIVGSGSVVSSTMRPAGAGPGDAGSVLRTVQLAATRPIRYLSCLVTRLEATGGAQAPVPAIAGPVAHAATAPAARAVTEVQIEVLATPRAISRARSLPPRVANMVQTFAELIGEAPYPDLSVALVEDNLPGGHSPGYFSIWLQPLASTPYTWINDPLALEGIYPSMFLAHEVAHQWWGQAVGWKNYHEHWLSEGLAQYFAAWYAEVHRGPEVMRELMQSMRQSAMNYSSQGPIGLGYRVGHIKRDPQAFRAVIYNKSAVVLHMLRRLIGDETFTAGLRRFYREHRFRKAGTDDLQRAFEAEGAPPLTNFFEGWIRRATIPELRVNTSIDESANVAVVRVEQTGDVFDLPLTVIVQYADGRNEPVTIPVAAARVEHRIPLDGRVRRIDTRDDLTLATYR